MLDLRSLVHGFLSSSCWLAANYRPFAKQLHTVYGIYEISPYGCTRWHRGSRYFRAVAPNGGRLFIKTDGDHALLKNEIAAFQALDAEPNIHRKFVPIHFHALNGRYRFAAFSWVPGIPLRQLLTRLSPEQIIMIANHFVEILDDLHTASIIHRDFTPDNLLVREVDGQIEQVWLVDFAFAVTQGTSTYDHTLPKIDLAHLGHGFKPEEFIWDDAYSAHFILQDLQRRQSGMDETLLQPLASRIGRNSYRAGQ